MGTHLWKTSYTLFCLDFPFVIKVLNKREGLTKMVFSFPHLFFPCVSLIRFGPIGGVFIIL